MDAGQTPTGGWPKRMEIEFNVNASQFSPPKANGAAARNTTSAAAGDAASVRTLSDLKNRLAQVPLTRSDTVAQATAVAGHPSYPPDDILDRVAVLLAIHLQP